MLRSLIILVILLNCYGLSCFAQNTENINSNEFMMDCMRQSGTVTNRQLVIWYAPEYWKMVFKQMNVSEETVKPFVTELNRYMIFCAVDYTVSTGGFNFKEGDEIRNSIVFTDSAGKKHLPLDPEKLNPTLKQVMTTMEPVLAKAMGQMGEGMKVFLFKMPMENEKPTITASSRNYFNISWDGMTAKYETPLPSMMPARYCPVDNAQMKGNWNYCPIHGAKLK